MNIPRDYLNASYRYDATHLDSDNPPQSSGRAGTPASTQPTASTVADKGEQWPYSRVNPASTSLQVAQPAMYFRSQAVFKVQGPTGPGTAFRLGPNNLFMTNSHVIPGDPRERPYTLLAGYEAKQNFDGAKDPVSARIGKVLYRSGPYRDPNDPSQGMDVVVFSIDQHDYQSGKLDRFGYLGIDTRPPHAGQQIYLPNYSGGYPEQIAFRDRMGRPARVATVPSRSGQRITFNMGVKRGSSGSPVIDAKTHDVIAIKPSGIPDGNDDRWPDAPNSTATPMSDVFPHIAYLFPGGVAPIGSPFPPELGQTAAGSPHPILAGDSAQKLPAQSQKPMNTAPPGVQIPARDSAAKPANQVSLQTSPPQSGPSQSPVGTEPTSPSTVPAWDPDKVYWTGDLISHNGKQYEARLINIGIAPGPNARFTWLPRSADR
ncbi:trypsin-like peptidase domain-containing protein [Dyella monticola]|nr:trypsin-like peptidase domain-containing protein [Dyella monticola]